MDETTSPADPTPPALTEADRGHLRRCIELARTALDGGDQPFGSVLVGVDGTVLFEDHNHEGSGDGTQHPEFAIARWAGQQLSAAERAAATVYTSGEHCPMCSAAHAWVGLGRIFFATSAGQTAQWYAEFGAGPSPVRTLGIAEIAPGVPAIGPIPEFADDIRELHRRRFARSASN